MRTKDSRYADAEICRINGGKRGTMLVGDESYGPTVIRITAVGDEQILAVAMSRNDQAAEGLEGHWTLSARNWKKLRNPR
jgi:hypothetical protein